MAQAKLTHKRQRHRRLQTPSDTPHVIVLVDTATGWGRRLIQGIHTYVQKHRPWHLWIEAMGQDETFEVPAGWAGHGVIARVRNQAMANHLIHAGLPVVNVSGIPLRKNPFPCVTTSVDSVVKLAVDHFLDRGFRHFGYCGVQRLGFVAAHQRAFEQELAKHNLTCHTFASVSSSAAKMPAMSRLAELGQWLKSLPKPIGIFTWGVMLGRDTIEACRMQDIAIPHEVAVLGGDYDRLLSAVCDPPLSGIAVPSEQIGYEAAQMLDQMMQGKPLEKNAMFIEPTGIINQLSTDILAVDDEDVREAIQFLRKHACEPIVVDNVVADLPVSRRQLERRFLQLLGRSPAHEIRRLRLARARELLAQTDLDISEIAWRVGYATQNYLNRVFKLDTGLTRVSTVRRCAPGDAAANRNAPVHVVIR